MCGISGIWHLNKEKLSLGKLEKFTDSMSHRGPDGRGFFIDNEVPLGLGHRRLSILDLSEAAAQPMQYTDDNLVICYNGEVFNFIELRKELEQFGFTFKTNSDTEVILAAYKKWGKDCLLKFNGMWAMAIWHKKEKKLFLARDRYGIKPFYYCYEPGKFFAFASETYAFKFLEDHSRRVAGDKIARTLCNPLWTEGSGYTIFEGIVQLHAGHYMELRADKLPEQKRWWNTHEHIPAIPASYDEQVAQFRELFENACRIRMRSDVTLASALSGGMDSSSVYCMLHNLMKRSGGNERTPENWQQAFVATFPGTSVDERAYAEEVIKYIDGKGVFIQQNFPDLANRVIQTTKLFDSITPTPIIAVSDIYKSMSENGIKVSLDGHGVDEMLYGYTGLASAVYTQALINNDEPYAKDILETFSQLHEANAMQTAEANLIKNGMHRSAQYKLQHKASLKKAAKNFIKAISNKNTSIPPQAANNWHNDLVCPPLKSLTADPYSLEKMSYSELLLFEEFHLTTLPLNFRDFDRASMMNSIEIRMPFMDWRLVTFVFGLPLRSKIGNGYTKRILRDAMKGLMPESIRTRKLKIGLAAPTADWFKGPLKEFVNDTANSKTFIDSPYWNGKLISNYMAENYKNNSWDKNNSARVWSYLNAHLIIN